MHTLTHSGRGQAHRGNGPSRDRRPNQHLKDVPWEPPPTPDAWKYEGAERWQPCYGACFAVRRTEDEEEEESEPSEREEKESEV
jgi:hypothetical protein